MMSYRPTGVVVTGSSLPFDHTRPLRRSGQTQVPKTRCDNDSGIFWRSVDTSGKVKNADYVAALMIADIYAFGPTKVVLIVTDTCAVMQKAWDIVMYEFPWMSALPCQPHVISLLLKDIGKTPEVSSPLHPCTHAKSEPRSTRANGVVGRRQSQPRELAAPHIFFSA